MNDRSSNVCLIIVALVYFCAVSQRPSFALRLPAFMKERRAMPQCDLGEPCRVDGYGLEFCACPGQRKCPSSHMKEIRGIEYHFCEQITLHNCSRGEDYAIHRGLRQQMKCMCQSPLEMQAVEYDIVNRFVRYKCEEPVRCSAGDVCKVRKRVDNGVDLPASLLIPRCQCGAGAECIEVETDDAQRIGAKNIRRRKSLRHAHRGKQQPNWNRNDDADDEDGDDGDGDGDERKTDNDEKANKSLTSFRKNVADGAKKRSSSSSSSSTDYSNPQLIETQDTFRCLPAAAQPPALLYDDELVVDAARIR